MKRLRRRRLLLTDHKHAPVARRISSTRFYASMDSEVDHLNKLLDIELEDALISDGSHLVEAIFPDRRLPFTVDEDLLHSLTTVYSSGRWITIPQQHSEPRYATWMNNIGLYLLIITHHPTYIMSTNQMTTGIALQEHTNHTRLRSWDAKHHDSPLPGSPIKRKTDITLLDISKSDRSQNDQIVQWSGVRAVCEVTSTPTYHSRIHYTIVSKALIMMNCQFNWRSIPSLSIIGDQFLVIACDRAGVIHSIKYHLHHDALVFLRILAGFMFGDDHLIGHDQSMRRNVDDQIVGITVAGQEYDVVKNVFSSQTLRGRATQLACAA
jgi:hypothetical protein